MVPDSWCEKDSLAHLECDWQYKYVSNSNHHKNLDGHITGRFGPVREDDHACQTACKRLGEKNNLPSAYCPGTRIWKDIEACPAAKASLDKALSKNLQGNWCGSNSLVWDTGRETTSEGTDCPLMFSMLTFRDFKCYNSSLADSGKGKKAFDQCCGNCLAAHATQTCHWDADDTGAGIRIATVDDCTKSKDPDNCYPGFGYDNAECVTACDNIGAATEAKDICPPEPNWNWEGGKQYLKIEKLHCGQYGNLATQNIKDTLNKFCAKTGKNFCASIRNLGPDDPQAQKCPHYQ